MGSAQNSLVDIPVDPILQHLVEKYPRLFHGCRPQSHSHVQPGWTALIDDLCLQLDGMLTDEQAQLFAVRQIKDKLGTLRFYFVFGSAFKELRTEGDSKEIPGTTTDVSDDRNSETGRKIRAAIEEATCRSNTICSVCSQPARLHHLGGLLSVRCDDHFSTR